VLGIVTSTVQHQGLCYELWIYNQISACNNLFTVLPLGHAASCVVAVVFQVVMRLCLLATSPAEIKQHCCCTLSHYRLCYAMQSSRLIALQQFDPSAAFELFLFSPFCVSGGGEDVPAGEITWRAQAAPLQQPWPAKELELLELRPQLVSAAAAHAQQAAVSDAAGKRERRTQPQSSEILFGLLCW
jgi:hypothetical protein